MQTQEQIAQNQLIAEFMGHKRRQETNEWANHKPWTIPEHGHFLDNQLKYHESWKWLMPVVEKISKHVYEQVGNETAFPRTFGMLDPEGKPMFRFNRMSLHTADMLIEATFEACVEFIEWYNSQLKEQNL